MSKFNWPARLAGLALAGLLLATPLAGGVSSAFAQENAVAAAEAAPADNAVAAAPAAEAAPAEAAAPAAAAPQPNKGDTTWMLVSTVLVLLMIIPGLALFYGGLVRQKNMLSMLMQVSTVGVIGMLCWVFWGYSLAFTDGGQYDLFVGGFSRLFLTGVTPASNVATFSTGVMIPELVFIAFQMTFAAITATLVLGGVAERMKFAGVVLFAVLWPLICYYPIAHMVWWWPGPDAVAMLPKGETIRAGLSWGFGAIDFAGGTVVHINAGIAALMGALILGPRVGFRKEAMPPHSLTLTLVGAGLLWVGWFGFNAGSNLEANGLTALAFVNTLVATAAATLAWIAGEALAKGKASMLGAASGAVAGLVAITPACGFVGPMGAIVIGAAGGFLCLWGVNGLKRLLGADDSLDVFGVHGVGGIVGALLTGVFAAPSLGGTGIFDYVANAASADYSIGGQVLIQLEAVITTIVWSGVVSFIGFKVVDALVGLRVSEEDEREGLDISSHGETAYHR